MQAEIGIIGGSGLYSMPGFEDKQEIQVETPFGPPSDAFIAGTLAGKRVVFLARHARGHRITPSELNFRANIFAMKKLGVRFIVSLSAVGSLKQEHAPGEFVLVDQFVDRTMGRQSTFFGEGLVAHVSFAHPVSEELRQIVLGASRAAGVSAKDGGCYLCMEGPAFSTLAESNLYRSWGMDVIGMTNLQEAKLAREAEIAYVSVAMVTDYDCWHPEHDAVTVADIIRVLHQNAENAARVVHEAVARIPLGAEFKAHSALKSALITDPKTIPQATYEKLEPIVGKYLAGSR